MICLTPITLKNEQRKKGSDYATHVVPCGKCPNCKKKRQNHWVFRLRQEQLDSFSSCFLTLTYNDENVPVTSNGYQTLVKEHFQNFMKRLRKNHQKKNKNVRIKYYAVGEYGGRTDRPHYHAIIFNLPQSVIEDDTKISEIWGKGNIMATECNSQTIAYTTKYINKSIGTDDSIQDDDRIKEFSLMSKKLGANYLNHANRDYYKRRKTNYITDVDGSIRSMPRYYKEKLYTDKEREEINISTRAYLEQNPQYQSEKQKLDRIKSSFDKHKKRNDQERNKI